MEIRRVKSHDLPKIKELSDHIFGKDYLMFDVLNEYLTKPLKRCYCLFQKNQLIGFCTVETIDGGCISSYFLQQTKFFSHYFNHSTIAVIQQLVITPSQQGNGYANQLLKQVLTDINEIDYYLCVCWDKLAPNPMKKLLINNQFESLKFISNYWFNESMHKKYHCATCGAPPCRCNAEVYLLKKAH